MPHRKHMTELVACRLDCPVLDELGHFGVEHARRLVGMLSEVRMVSSVALDADAPALLGHSEDESPTVLRVQIGIGQYEEALILLQLHIVFEVLKDLPCMELLHPCVASHPCLYHSSPLQLREVLLDVVVLSFLL